MSLKRKLKLLEIHKQRRHFLFKIEQKVPSSNHLKLLLSYLAKIDFNLDITPFLGVSIDISGTDSPKMRLAMFR